MDPIRNTLARFPAWSPRIGWIAAALPLAALLAACGGAPNRSYPGLTVKGQTAYLAHNFFVSAVNTDTGTLMWKYPSEGNTPMLFYTSPTLDGAGHLVAGSYDGSVVALNPETGSEVWKRAGDGTQSIVGPVLDGPDGLYVSMENGSMFVLDRGDGSVIREIDLGGAAWGPMATDGERVFAGTLQHFVAAVDVETGKLAWKTDLGASIAGGLVLAEDRILVGTLGNQLVALDPETGRVDWRLDAGDWVWAPPAVRDGVAYFADMGGTLRAVSVKDGAVVWTAKLEGKAQLTPVISGDVILVGTDDWFIRAFGLSDGVKRWEQKQEGAVLGGMAVAGGRLLVTTQGGKFVLVALSLANGGNAWSIEEPK